MMGGKSLARRIVASFVLMTLVVAGLFSLTVMMSISYTEENYASSSMSKRLDDILGSLDKGLPFHLEADTELYVRGPDGQPQLPSWLARVKPGFQEAYRDGEEHHVVAREVDGTLYVLVQDQEEFERREDVLYVVIAFAFALSLLAAWGLGLLMARRVIAPVIQLSEQVQHRGQLLTAAPPLAADYASDEVGRLAAAFDATLGELRQALGRERIFTSDVSHELRTPLMVIASTCDVLLAQGLSDPKQEKQIRRIQASCVEMQELVETFMRLARTTDGTRDEAETTLVQLAGEQVDRLRPEAAGRGLELTLVSEGDDAGYYPAPLLRAVISNLLRNAIHYTDQGFVRLVLRQGGFSVCDSGAGIPPEKRESVFQPFVRGDSSRGDGLGLGLSLVQRICQRQGWRIRLEEHRDGGCEFRVDLLPA